MAGLNERGELSSESGSCQSGRLVTHDASLLSYRLQDDLLHSLALFSNSLGHGHALRSIVLASRWGC
jgi:hypothetical protein